jgi:integrase
MASVSNDGDRRYRVLFEGPDGRRRAVHLVQVSERQAEAFRLRIEALVGAAKTASGSVDPDTARWVERLPDGTHAKLARAGLVRPRGRSASSLGKFLDDFLASVQVKAGTLVTYKQTRRVLVEHFGEAASLRDVGPAEADRWRQWMRGNGLADSTIARRVKSARQMFRVAVRWKLLDANPFEDVKAGSMANKARQHFITREVAAKVLDACPDAQWRLLFALSRYGGLRCPSEHLALTWADVDWATGRVRVPSSKTAHLAGGDHRYIPLFPELLPYLREAFESAEPGTTHVITSYRQPNTNLRTQLLRIMRRAGVEPWPKLFHNLRSTRQTELEEHYPTHVVCAWLGNSEAVARQHYLQVRDVHFDQAAGMKAQPEAQHNTERGGMGKNVATIDPRNQPDFPGGAEACGIMPGGGMTPTGFEPVSRP